MSKRMVGLGLVLVFAAGCASNPVPDLRTSDSEDQGGKVLVSRKAFKLFEEQEQVTAAFRGQDRYSQLICEDLVLKGSHITRTFCYTRAERDRMNLNHQEEWREITTPGAKAFGR